MSLVQSYLRICERNGTDPAPHVMTEFSAFSGAAKLDGLGARDFQLSAAALAQVGSQLRSLTISDTAVADVGDQLVALLAAAPELESFCFQHCQVPPGKKFAKNLATVLASGKVAALTLSGLQGGSELVAAVCSALEAFPRLRTLSLFRTQLSGAIVTDMLSHLPQSGVQSIDLRYCGISNQDGRKLLGVVEKTPGNLVSIRAEYNNFSAATMERLREANRKAGGRASGRQGVPSVLETPGGAGAAPGIEAGGRRGSASVSEDLGVRNSQASSSKFRGTGSPAESGSPLAAEPAPAAAPAPRGTRAREVREGVSMSPVPTPAPVPIPVGRQSILQPVPSSKAPREPSQAHPPLPGRSSQRADAQPSRRQRGVDPRGPSASADAVVVEGPAAENGQAGQTDRAGGATPRVPDAGSRQLTPVARDDRPAPELIPHPPVITPEVFGETTLKWDFMPHIADYMDFFILAHNDPSVDDVQLARMLCPRVRGLLEGASLYNEELRKSFRAFALAVEEKDSATLSTAAELQEKLLGTAKTQAEIASVREQISALNSELGDEAGPAHEPLDESAFQARVSELQARISDLKEEIKALSTLESELVARKVEIGNREREYEASLQPLPAEDDGDSLLGPQRRFASFPAFAAAREGHKAFLVARANSVLDQIRFFRVKLSQEM